MTGFPIVLLGRSVKIRDMCFHVHGSLSCGKLGTLSFDSLFRPKPSEIGIKNARSSTSVRIQSTMINVRSAGCISFSQASILHHKSCHAQVYTCVSIAEGFNLGKLLSCTPLGVRACWRRPFPTDHLMLNVLIGFDDLFAADLSPDGVEVAFQEFEGFLGMRSCYSKDCQVMSKETTLSVKVISTS